MRFSLTEDRTALVDAVTQFLAKEMPSAALRGWLADTDRTRYRQWWQQCAELGWSGLFAGDEYGGLSDQPLVDACLVGELAGQALAPNALNGVSTAVSALAADDASDWSEELAGLVDGSLIAASAFEEGTQWSLDALRTRAVRDGDCIVITGAKINVADATNADRFLVTCSTDDGPALALVPASVDGVSVSAGRSIDLLRSYGTVHFNAVRLPSAALLASGSDAATAAVRVSTCLQLAESVGAVDRLLELTIDYARNRYAFGRPIGSFQALKHRIADLVLWDETCKATTDIAIDAVSTGDPDSDLLISVAKSYVGDQSVRVAQECTQMFGGIGLTWEHDAHLYLRRLTANRALLGTPAQHRAAVASTFGITVDEAVGEGAHRA